MPWNERYRWRRSLRNPFNSYQRIKLLVRSHEEHVTIWAARDGFVLEAMKQPPVLNAVGVTPNTEASAERSSRCVIAPTEH